MGNTGNALDIIAVGMVSGLAMGAEANIAAMQCQYNCFDTTDFIEPQSGDNLIGGPVPYPNNVCGNSRLIKMALDALADLRKHLPCEVDIHSCPMVICLPEKSRADWTNRKNATFCSHLSQALGGLAQGSIFLRCGRASAGEGLIHVRQLLEDKGHSHVIFLGVDSLLTVHAISHFSQHSKERRGRLLCTHDPDGFIPGEAGAAVCFTRADRSKTDMPIRIHGVGTGREPAYIFSGEVLNADGLTEAIRNATQNAHHAIEDTDFRILGATGESYFFKESALAMPRLFTRLRSHYDMLHIMDAIGECGAATSPAIMAFIYWTGVKRQLPGQFGLCHLSNDDQRRAAFVFEVPA